MKKSLWKRVLAVIAGAVVSILLSVGTDAVMQKMRIFPVSGRAMSDGLFALALAYRTVYGVLGAYITAMIAPNRPMLHALILGAIGTAVGVVGLVVRWHEMPELGPRWYAIGLVALGMIQWWVGGRLRVMQIDETG